MDAVGVWEADVPTQIGQYPALARMIYRGDVQESEVISTRRVSLADLESGKFSFSDQVVQKGDVKSFGGAVEPAVDEDGLDLAKYVHHVPRRMGNESLHRHHLFHCYSGGLSMC